MIPQLHFDFDEAEEAFRVYRENEQIYGDDIALVVSNHPYSPGYWIEKTPDPALLPPTDKMYQGQAVDELEAQIRKP